MGRSCFSSEFKLLTFILLIQVRMVINVVHQGIFIQGLFGISKNHYAIYALHTEPSVPQWKSGLGY